MAAAPVYYKSVDLSALQFEPLAKQHRLYVAGLAPPLLVQTPPVELATSVAGGDGEEVPFVFIKPTGQFRQWLHDVEDAIVARAIQNKADWFRKDVDDDALRHNYKSFFRGDEFKLRKDGEVPVFDSAKDAAGPEEACSGSSVRCVLELARVCFGRQEFGAMWRLVQARLVQVPPCLIDDDEEEPARDDDDATDAGSQGEGGAIDEQEFL